MPGRARPDCRRRRLRRRPARLRAGRGAQALEAGELGHLQGRLEPHRHLAEFRGPSEAVAGETVTVEAFQPGDKVKVSGISIGKGFQGTIKRHRFHRGPMTHGSHNVRKPGSIGASATPSRVFKGMKMAGRMGGKRVTQLGLAVHDVDAEREPPARQGRRPGPEERRRRDPGGEQLMAAPKAPVLDAAGKKAKDVTLEEAVFGAEVKPHLVHETVRAELNAARAAARARPRAAGSSRAGARSRGARRAPGAPARARPARRTGRAAASPSRRRRATSRSRSTARRGAPPSAARCPRTPPTARSALVDGSAFDAPSTKQAVELLAELGQGRCRCSSSPRRTRRALIKSFRNSTASSSPCRRSSRCATSSGRARCSSTEAALDAVSGERRR